MCDSVCGKSLEGDSNLNLKVNSVTVYLALSKYFIGWAKAPALYVTMSQVLEVGEVHFLDLAFRAQIELRNVKVKVTLR